MYYELKYEQFENMKNAKFELLGFDRELELELVNITEKILRSGHESFSLLFQSSKDFLLEQSIYRMKNESIGEGELFIVPIEENENGFLYEAVFNRKTEI